MEPVQLKQDYWSYVKRQFKKNKRAVFSLWLVGFLALIAIFADFIANEKPIAFHDGESWNFPIVRDYGVKLGVAKWPEDLSNIQWGENRFEKAIYPIIPYSPTTQDYKNAQFTSPFGEQNVPSKRWRHWLGTEQLGRDVLSAMIHGTRIAFKVGLVSMFIATLIGIVLGSLAGFYGDERLRFSRVSIILSIVFLIPVYFYAFQSRAHILSDAIGESFIKFFGQLFISFLIVILFLGLIWLIGKPLKKNEWLAHQISIPIDIMVQRLIEVLVSIPSLFLIIAIVAIAKPSIMLVMAVIGLTSWTEIARFIRAELLRVRNLEYIEAANALGYSNLRALFRHAIPNAISPVLITIAFGIAAAILVEGYLSFIGIGIPPEILTWGKLLSLSRSAPWWFALAPGFAIFLVVTLFNLLGEGLTDALDPRQKQ
ncbi:MAG TPA: ABC transporter permease [Chitinophagales bacterium]|nr:ABC transporter permease [Chitinophagales bacterium]